MASIRRTHKKHCRAGTTNRRRVSGGKLWDLKQKTFTILHESLNIDHLAKLINFFFMFSTTLFATFFKLFRIFSAFMYRRQKLFIYFFALFFYHTQRTHFVLPSQHYFSSSSYSSLKSFCSEIISKKLFSFPRFSSSFFVYRFAYEDELRWKWEYV